MQEYARLQGGRVPVAEHLADAVVRRSGVDEVFPQKHVPSLDPGGRVVQPFHLAGGVHAAVASGHEKVDVKRARDTADEVAHEDEGSLEEPQDQQPIGVGVELRDLPSEALDLVVDLSPRVNGSLQVTAAGARRHLRLTGSSINVSHG